MYIYIFLKRQQVGRQARQAEFLAHGIFLGPGASSSLILDSVSLVHMSNFWNQRIIWVWVRQKRAYREQHLGYREGRAPLLFEDVKADATIAIDVGVEHLCSEGNLGWLEWVIGWEVDGHQKHTSCKWALTWTHNSCLPVEHVITNRASTARSGRVLLQVLQLLVNSL